METLDTVVNALVALTLGSILGYVIVQAFIYLYKRIIAFKNRNKKIDKVDDSLTFHRYHYTIKLKRLDNGKVGIKWIKLYRNLYKIQIKKMYRYYEYDDCDPDPFTLIIDGEKCTLFTDGEKEDNYIRDYLEILDKFIEIAITKAADTYYLHERQIQMAKDVSTHFEILPLMNYKSIESLPAYDLDIISSLNNSAVDTWNNYKEATSQPFKSN